MEFTDSDRQRAIDTHARVGDLVDEVRALRLEHARGVRRAPARTSRAIVRAVSQRALILVGIGIAIGSALGGAGIALVRALVVRMLAAGGLASP